MREFDYSLDYENLDLREHPELYSVGRGEQGVLTVQPYKSELLPLWRFRTEADARASAAAITDAFRAYLDADDFVGADMARKFLQMGYTRSRRYANHRGGKKYDGPVPDDELGVSGAHGRAEKDRVDVGDQDPEKVAAAKVFKAAWRAAADDPTYKAMKRRHRAEHEDV